MPRKTKIIFISVFILVGLVFLVYYISSKKNSNSSSGTNSSAYGLFGSLFNTKQPTTDSSTLVNENPSNQNSDNPEIVGVGETKIRLHQLTDFAVSGAAFFEDTRPLPVDEIPVKGGGEPAQTTTEVPLKGGDKPQTKTEPINTKNKKVADKKPVVPTVETVPSLRYVEKVTGHIYQMYLDTKTVSKISNSTIPGIYEAIFDSKASSIIYRYLSGDNKTISSYFATLGADKGEFLPSNIIDLSLSPDKTQFFYLVKNSNGISGWVRSFYDNKKSQVFSSPYSEWLSQWVGASNVFLTTRASSSVNGSLFSLNTTNGTLKKILGGVRGLTTLSNKDGLVVLYSSYNDSEPELNLLNTSSHFISNLNIGGLPEKCVWKDDNITIYCAIPDTLGSKQPDSWYQGLTSFDDTFVKINSLTGEVSSIADVDSLGNQYLDATHLFLNKENTALYFINKKDGTLWSLDLN
jgi:hypothetical protein